MNYKGTKLPKIGDWLLVMGHWSWVIGRRNNKNQLSITHLLLFLSILGVSTKATAQPTGRVVVVNSNQDGAIQADDGLTLREAIAIVNGQLSAEQLSEAERAQIQPLDSNTPSRIEFNLPSGDTTIRLQEMLPPLASPGLVVDGTTQPGYDATRSATAEIEIPIPVVEITPAPDTDILRGLTIVADGVTVRGLSIYGFTKAAGATLNTPPADIFIDRPPPVPDAAWDVKPWDWEPRGREEDTGTRGREDTENLGELSPKGVVVELNWLGILPDEGMPETPSAFGVVVFNSLGTTIERNRIANHEGSAIITSVQAENLLVTENIIVGNGIAGMPDAIRLEGAIANSQITGNLICGNDGSGVYLFKPDGSVQIRDNDIIFNGRRLRRAAVYLMGDNNQVIDNRIAYQAGPGVVVTSYPKSDLNVIESNRFAGLEGLSIDLNAQQNVEPLHFQRGDGPNPPRNSPNRRKETGNSAINAPQFTTREFVVRESQVQLSGQADSGSSVQLYRVSETSSSPYGPLSEPLTTVETDEQGQFSVALNDLQAGDRVSAIATHPQYGTSEPARNALIQSSVPSSQSRIPDPQTPTPVIPRCTTAQLPPTTPEPIPPEPAPPPEPLRLRVPRNVHFALDRSDLSPESAAVLDEIARVLLEYPFLTVELQGHTDPRASDAYNQALGERRALSVRNYLLRQGIAPERMTIRSFGERQRRTAGTDVLDYARDRRVEVIFQDTRGLEIIFETQESDLQVEPTGGTR
ncbi:MAG: OmpA family protein [Coleofasciculus sp. S288]|nr:OmpA family protein [Coleofasciculus sp. S288]